MCRLAAAAVFAVLAASASAQNATPQGPPPTKGLPATANPFPALEAAAGVVSVNFREFAVIPDAAGTSGEAARMMHLVDEPGSKRMFVSTMRGALYSVSYDGTMVAEYLDINAPGWGHPVQFQGSERGFQSFAFHPQFNRKGSRGYGKFYTYFDTSNMTPAADFTPADGAMRTHDTVLLEWTAKNPEAASYDGGAPKEVFRVAQPFANHNGSEIAFNTLTPANSPEFGLLYIGVADGGSGGDPMNLAQNLSSAFGKILRIDPLGANSKNGKYGIPKSNPFVARPDALAEIFAFGVRNPQRFSWDSKDGRMFVADIGQNVVEEISPVTIGANLGWNKWEGSYEYGGRQFGPAEPRSDKSMTWPIAEFDHTDPLFPLQRAAVTGIYVYREKEIKQLQNLLIFGDNPSGEIFYVNPDRPSRGGHDQIRRIMFNDKGMNKTLLELIREKNAAQGRPPATRADLRIGRGPRGQIFILNKRDGVIRLLVP